MEDLIHAEFLSPGPEALRTCEQWDRFCHTLYHAYRDQALAEFGG